MEHAGHRKRLIQKLQQGVLLEHETLEALLFNAMPRKNTNDLAHKLLAEFGSVTGVLSAPMEALKQVDGVGDSVASYLRCIGTFCERYYAEYKERFPRLYEEKSFSAFVFNEYVYLEKEVLDCFLVDRNGYILQRKRFSSGEKNYASLLPEDLTEAFSVPGCAGVILVHNHPGGSAEPSAADENLTKQAQLLCSFHNLLLCDHIICGKNNTYSYYKQGKLAHISKLCSVRKLLAEGNYGNTSAGK